jgi:hypothetical protein
MGPIRLCKHVSSRLEARCLAIEHPKNGECTIFLSLDTQGLPAQTNRAWFGQVAIEERITAEFPRVTQVFAASSHSHCSPDTTGLWGSVPDSYAELLIDRAVETAREALSSLQEASLWFGTCSTKGLLRSQVRWRPHDRVEPRIFVLEARESSSAGRPIGRILAFAAHATVASGNHMTADWPGVVASRLDDDLGGITVVLPGCIGRTQPLYRGSGTQQDVVAYAEAVLAQLRSVFGDSTPEALREIEQPEMCSASAEIYLRPYNLAISMLARRLGRLARSRADGTEVSPGWALRTEVSPVGADGTEVSPGRAPRTEVSPSPSADAAISDDFANRSKAATKTRVKLIRIGHLLFVGMPGEAYPNLQWAIEGKVQRAEAVSGRERITPIVCSLVGDQIGYLIYPPETYPALAMESMWNDNALLCVSPTAATRLLGAVERTLPKVGVRLEKGPSAQISEGPPGEENSSLSPASARELALWDLVGIPSSAIALCLAVAGLALYPVIQAGKIARNIAFGQNRVLRGRIGIGSAAHRNRNLRRNGHIAPKRLQAKGNTTPPP